RRTSDLTYQFGGGQRGGVAPRAVGGVDVEGQDVDDVAARGEHLAQVVEGARPAARHGRAGQQRCGLHLAYGCAVSAELLAVALRRPGGIVPVAAEQVWLVAYLPPRHRRAGVLEHQYRAPGLVRAAAEKVYHERHLRPVEQAPVLHEGVQRGPVEGVLVGYVAGREADGGQVER